MVKHTSLCGLGQSAPNPVLSTLRYFRDEYLALLNRPMARDGAAWRRSAPGADQPPEGADHGASRPSRSTAS